MNINFDITTPDNAYGFLLDTLELQPGELIMEYLVNCGRNVGVFLERNRYRLDNLNLQDVRFVAFHVTASLDDCKEIKENGIRDLQYVLSHNTMLSRLLKCVDINFDIENRIMNVNGRNYDVDYDYYRGHMLLTSKEECLDSIARRIYYDFCIDGFWHNDDIERYGTDIHKRPEFISKLIELSPKARNLDAFWRAKSKPYKVFFYATLDQIHKFTFDLEKNYDPYTEDEQGIIKDWMLNMAVNRAFGPEYEHVIYIRDHQHIPPEQIIKCEIIETNDEPVN